MPSTFDKPIAPATTPPPKAELTAPMQEEQGWKTVEAPELYSFEKVGSEIAGVLIDVSAVEVQHKKVVQYVLSFGDRTLKLLGTYDLVQKITRAHIGCQVRIKYRGTDPTISKNGNAMKIFHVQIKGTPSTQPRDSSPITDEDIPF